jgi:glycosyltransferase involved in cell wall biosynthesis
MKYSVVIPLFNMENTIQRAILSVINQSLQDFEIIIIDDGSTDRSVEIASKIYDRRLRIIKQNNLGVSAARNRGIIESKSEWIAFLDADDEWKSGFLETIDNLKNRFPECGLFASYYEVCRKDKVDEKKFFSFFQPHWSGVINDYFLALAYGYPFNSSSVVVVKSALINIQGFPEGIPYSEDIVTWIKLFLVTKFSYINEPLSIYYYDNKKIHIVEDSVEKENQKIKFLEDLLNNGHLPKTREKSAHMLMKRFMLEEANYLLKKGDKKKSLDILLKSWNSSFLFNNWFRLFIKTITSF